MNLSTRLGLFAVLAVVILTAGRWTVAQTLSVIPETPVVLSGPDVGFRVEGRRGDARVGRFVVRIDGKWVEALPAGGVVRLTSE